MRRARLYAHDDLRHEQVATPDPGPGEVLLAVDATTLCPTDHRIISGEKTTGVQLPVVPGHEVAGRIAAVGGGVEGYPVGAPVALMPGVPCRVCSACRGDLEHLCQRSRMVGYAIDGGFADHMIVPRDALAAGSLVLAGEGVDAAALALAEPLGCVLTGHTVTPVRLGDTVVVLGAGPIGLLHVQVARLSGAQTVVVSQPSAWRRRWAERFGADVVVDPTSDDLAAAVADVTDGVGADVVFVCAGAPTLVDDAIALARPGGAVNVFARVADSGRADIDANAIHYRQVRVSGSSNQRRRDFHRAVGLISTGRVDTAALVTHRFGLDQLDEALATVTARDALKVAIVPQPTAERSTP